MNKTLPRRTFLKGLGTALSLPLLDAMIPRTAWAAGTPAAPVRMSYIFFPNGVVLKDWKPAGTVKDFQLGKTMQPLEKFKSQLNLFTGLTQHHGRANGDGAGDHARNAGSFLTGAQPRKTAGADIHVGISADQLAASLIGSQTRLPSLELGVERGRNAGSCDSGYSCAYSNSISWKSATTPMAKEINPRLAFERLFGAGGENERNKAKQEKYRQSILDLVQDDAAALKKQLGNTDQRKMDEYFNSVRELEQRIERSATQKVEVPEYNLPEGIPRETTEHIRLMYDIQWLAFQSDATRIVSFMVANAGSNRSYPEVEVRSGHHELSHHQGDEKKLEQIQKIDQFLITQFAYFLDKLQSTKEGNGTLLDNCLIMYGSGIGDGNRHNHDDLPIILAGSGGKQIPTGRFLEYPINTPLNNLFLSMMNKAGANADKIGDSTGQLKGLDA